MGDQWSYRAGSQSGAVDELGALQRAQDELWAKLRGEVDPDRRMALLSEFADNRARIERLTELLGASGRPVDGPSVSYRVEIVDGSVDPTAAMPAGTPNESDEPLVFDAAGDLVPSSGLARAHAASLDSERAPAPHANGHRPPVVEGRRSQARVDRGVVDHGAAHRDALDDDALDHDRLDDDVVDDGSLDDGSLDDRSVDHDPLADGSVDHDPVGHAPLDDEAADDAVDHDGFVHEDPSDDGADHRRLVDPGFGRQRSGRYQNLAAEERAGRDGAADDHEYDDVGDAGGRRGRASGTDHEPLGVFSRPANPDRASGRLVPPPPPVRRKPAQTSQTPVVGTRPAGRKAKGRSVSTAGPDSSRRILLVLGGLGVVLAMAWFLLGRSPEDADTNVASDAAVDADADEVAGPTADLELGEIVVGLRNMGLSGVLAERRGDVIHLVGTVATAADRDAAVAFAESMAPGQTIDASELSVGVADAGAAPAADTGRAGTFQSELNRIVAATPIIFDVDQTELTELHTRILNSIASIINAYPEYEVTVVGFADGTGSDESNRAISLRRAESVEAYLVSLGVPDEALTVAARGEETASGSDALANLERRVEFEVVVPAGAEQPLAAAPPIRVAIIAPSARNDLAFTQSMVDAVDLVAGQRGNVEVAITDSTFVPDDAEAALRGYADDGYDLVIAHGSQFGSILLEVAPQYPETAFAWGTASDTFGLPNVYAYDAAAHQGGYVLGAMSTLLSATGVVGVVGPIEVGDAQLYVDGFAAGARASKPDATVLVNYTGSFSDLTLAAEAAQAHVVGGADVLTGSAQMVVGAVSVAQESGAVWFGTQSNQSSLAPSLVAASQVYHWEVILEQIIADVDAGVLGGGTYTADLANGGLVIEFNPDYALPDDVRRRADEIIAGIVDGSIQVPVG